MKSAAKAYRHDLIRAAREARRLSIEQLARKIDLSPRQLYNIEAGRSVPLATTLGRLATALKVPVARFYVSA